MAASIRTAAHPERGQSAALPGLRFGGPRRPRRASEQPTTSDTSLSPFYSAAGSHMPLDTGIHWHWRNPLNVLPAFLLVLLVFALLSLVL